MAVIEEREAQLARGDALWEDLRMGLEAHQGKLLGPGTDWTGHDVYAHFTRWQELTIRNLREALAGRRPQRMDEDEETVNMRWRQEDRRLSTNDMRERCLASRRELRDMLAAMPAEQWSAWGYRFAPDIDGEHYEHHLAMLETAR
jgi:hypothetical protein